MAFFLAALFLFSGPSPASPDTSVVRQSRAQVRHYVKQIKSGHNRAINLWALAEVGRGGPAIRAYTRRYLQKQKADRSVFTVFRDTSISYQQRLQELAISACSAPLLIAALLAGHNQQERESIAREYARRVGYPNAGNIRYDALIHAILKGQPVTQTMLPAEVFRPLHFFLLVIYRPANGRSFSKNYLKKITDNWHISGPNSLKQILKRVTLFHTFYATYQYQETARLYRPILDDPLFPNSFQKLLMLRSLDYSMYRLGYYHRNLKLIRRRSLPLARYLNEEHTVLKIRISRAVNYYYLGKTRKSKKTYLRLLADSTITAKPYISKARLHNNLATAYWKTGDFGRYLNIEFQALNEAKKEHNYAVHSQVLINLFTYYRVNKDFNSAREYLSRAKKMALQENNKKDLARVTFYEGLLYRDLDANDDRALASFNRALKLLSNNSYYNFQQNLLSKKAKLLEKQQKYHRARTVYQQALDIARNKNDLPNLLFTSFNKVNTYLEQHITDSARVMMDTLNTASLKPLDFPRLVKAKTVQARYRALTERPKRGIRQLKPVITQILKRSRQSGDIETGFWQVEPEYLDAFQLYADLLIATHQPARAVEALDRLKTINNGGIYHSELLRAQALGEKELSRYKRMTKKLDDLRRQFLAAGQNQQKKIQQAIDRLSAKKNALEKKAGARRSRKPAPVSQIQRRLDAHTRVLHLTDLNDTFYLAVISRTAVHFKKIPVTARLHRQFQHSIKKLAAGQPDLTELYRLNGLLGLDKLPSHVDKLTIIPDSYLYQLPLDVLPLEPPDGPYDYGSAHYLVERFKTRYMTSLRDFNKKKARDSYKYSFAGYGISHFGADRPALQPLPNAKTEVQSILAQLKKLDHKKMYLNRQATVSTFMRTAPRARILHLATHSRVNTNNPLFSTIYFKRPGGPSMAVDSGRVFAYQLFNLHLSNELVMLNSCESGSGSYLQGTGVVGISRALRYAGARSLVLNIWSVNDKFASELASQFYHYLDEGNNKAEALRKARLYFLENSNANPHFWGSYMLLGDKEAIIKPYRKLNRIVAAAFMGVFLTLITASSLLQVYRKRKQ